MMQAIPTNRILSNNITCVKKLGTKKRKSNCPTHSTGSTTNALVHMDVECEIKCRCHNTKACRYSFNLPGIHSTFKWNLALVIWQLPLGNQSLQISPIKYQSLSYYSECRANMAVGDHLRNSKQQMHILRLN